jgi:hypothetical protein
LVKHYPMYHQAHKNAPTGLLTRPRLPFPVLGMGEAHVSEAKLTPLSALLDQPSSMPRVTVPALRRTLSRLESIPRSPR